MDVVYFCWETEILKSTDGFQSNEWSREEERCDGKKKGGKGFGPMEETEYYSRALLLRECYFFGDISQKVYP